MSARKLSAPQRAALQLAAADGLAMYQNSRGVWRCTGAVREATVKALTDLGLVRQEPAAWGSPKCPIVPTAAGRAVLDGERNGK